MIIKKIFDGDCDTEVHCDFLKFGRGEYSGRYVIEVKKQSKGWSIKTGPEFVNYLVSQCLSLVEGEISVKGIIVSTTDLSSIVSLPIIKASNFQGVRKLQIDTTAPVQSLLELIQAHPRAFFALSFSGDNFTLKVKAKAPKSGKPGKSSEDGPKADFCTLKTTRDSFVRDLIFDHSSFTEATVSHTLSITDIVYPSNVEDLSPKEVREQSKRKGILTRRCTIDGVKKKSDVSFVA